nr:Exocyst complex component 4 [Polyrhizophydium stewartii]
MLNMDLSATEEAVAAALPERRTRFLFDGLGELMAHTLVCNLRYIRAVNKAGVLRLVRNVQSLQQNLTNLACAHQQNLDRARRYYELLEAEAQDIVQTVPDHAGLFTYDEYKALLDLLFHDALADGSAPALKKYNEFVQQLKDYFVKHRS